MATIYNSITPNKIKIDYSSNGSSNNLNYDSNFLLLILGILVLMLIGIMEHHQNQGGIKGLIILQ